MVSSVVLALVKLSLPVLMRSFRNVETELPVYFLGAHLGENTELLPVLAIPYLSKVGSAQGTRLSIPPKLPSIVIYEVYKYTINVHSIVAFFESHLSVSSLCSCYISNCIIL